MMRIRCNCGMTQLYVKCGEWITADEKTKVAMACCQDQCPKIMACGHRCTFICHTGECSKPESCKKKVKLYCPCKRRKLEFACNKAQSQKLSCDNECQQLKDKVCTLLQCGQNCTKRLEKWSYGNLEKIEKF